MNVLGISGTPKRGGIADRLLDKALAGARSSGSVVEKVVLNDLSFRPCQECGGCDKTGVCVLDDDLKPLYHKLLSADAIIVSSPIYFGTVSAQLKAMIDRLQCLWIAKTILKQPLRGNKAGVRRKGFFLCVAGKDVPEYFDCARRVVRILFSILDVEYSGELYLNRLNDRAKDERFVEDGLQKSFNLGSVSAR